MNKVVEKVPKVTRKALEILEEYSEVRKNN